MTSTVTPDVQAVRLPPEQRHADELARLAAADSDARPAGWKLSPRAVRRFSLGDEALQVQRKFFGDDPLVDRCIVTLMGHQGLMLVGEPGTAKSLLSELLTAAISGDSGLTVQGTAGTTEDHIKYSWNYALLLAEGPSQKALVPSPVYQAMRRMGILLMSRANTSRFLCGIRCFFVLLPAPENVFLQALQR